MTSSQALSTYASNEICLMSSWLLLIQQSQQPTLKGLSPIHTGSVLPISTMPPWLLISFFTFPQILPIMSHFQLINNPVLPTPILLPLLLLLLYQTWPTNTSPHPRNLSSITHLLSQPSDASPTPLTVSCQLWPKWLPAITTHPDAWPALLTCPLILSSII